MQSQNWLVFEEETHGKYLGCNLGWKSNHFCSRLPRKLYRCEGNNGLWGFVLPIQKCRGERILRNNSMWGLLRSLRISHLCRFQEGPPCFDDAPQIAKRGLLCGDQSEKEGSQNLSFSFRFNFRLWKGGTNNDHHQQVGKCSQYESFQLALMVITSVTF